MNFKNLRWEVERVAECEIVLNRKVFVSIVVQDIEEKVPFKPLILTPLAKIVDNCLPLRFCWNFFCIHVPDIISNLNNNKTSSWNKMSINFHIPQRTVNEVITNNMVTPCKTKCATYFIFSTDQY